MKKYLIIIITGIISLILIFFTWEYFSKKINISKVSFSEKNIENHYALSEVEKVNSDVVGEKLELNVNTQSNYFSDILIEYNGAKVKVFVDKPKGNEVDVLLVFHGTTMKDSRIVKSAKMMLEKTREIVKRKNLMIISVAYPEENLLMGDNIKEAEAALLWTKNDASKVLNVKINKIFLLGHSQGGYLVTRLNTMYKTDGVIANGAGPIDLAFRCKLDESGKIKKELETMKVCELLKKEYGSVFENPDQYTNRSMINFSSGYKSKILFIQGMNDENIVQLKLWPKFKKKLMKCEDCAEYKILEIENAGHKAGFQDINAIEAINNFLLN